MLLEYRVCSKCKESKHRDRFSINRHSYTGFQNQCKDCCKKFRQENAEKYRQYRIDTREARKEKRLQNKDHIRAVSKAYEQKTKNRPSKKYGDLKSQAKTKNREMNISYEEYLEIIKDRTCYYCDYNFSEDGGHSLNRIDSKKGYLLDNVKPCCKTCNSIMLDFSIEDLEPRLYKILKRMKK